MTESTISLEERIRAAVRLLRNLPDSLESEDDPAFTTEQRNFLEKRLYEARALLESDNHSPLYADVTLYVHQLLANHRQIAAIWSVEDVQGIRPDLTEEKAWEVLEQVGRKHDAEWGITWTTLEAVADDMFPQTDSSSEEAGHGN